MRQDLFQRRKVRDLSLPEGEDRPRRSWKGVNVFHMVAAILLLLLGTVSILTGIIGQYALPWISTGLSLLGSISTMAGIFMMLESVKERKSIDNLVKKAIMRTIHETN